MKNMTAGQLRKRLRETFGGAVRAVSWKDDFDFYAVPQVRDYYQEPEKLIMLLFPDPGKNFHFEILSIEENAEEWTTTIPSQKWSFRPIPERDLPLYLSAMKDAGVDINV